MELMRFLAVSVGGVVVDLAVAYTLARLGVPLWMAATAGFVLAAGLNYALHELWTFHGGARQLSAGRAARYLSASILVLLSRLGMVVWLSDRFDPDYALAILVTAAGVSFVVNFLISKILIFTAPDGRLSNDG